MAPTTCPFGTQIGAFFYGGSGTPLTTYVNTLNGTEIFVNGRGDLDRTAMLTQTDLLLSHELRHGRTARRLRFELNVLNVFNQKTSRHTYNYLQPCSRRASEIDLANTDLRQGYDYERDDSGDTDGANAIDPRYGQDDLFNEGTSGHFLVRYSF